MIQTNTQEQDHYWETEENNIRLALARSRLLPGYIGHGVRKHARDNRRALRKKMVRERYSA